MAVFILHPWLKLRTFTLSMRACMCVYPRLIARMYYSFAEIRWSVLQDWVKEVSSHMKLRFLHYTITLQLYAMFSVSIFYISLSGILYSTVHFYINYDIVVLWMTTYPLSRCKCTSSQYSNWKKEKSSDQNHKHAVFSDNVYGTIWQQAAIRFSQLWNNAVQYIQVVCYHAQRIYLLSMYSTISILNHCNVMTM